MHVPKKVERVHNLNELVWVSEQYEHEWRCSTCRFLRCVV
jgi:hypothetical protein